MDSSIREQFEGALVARVQRMRVGAGLTYDFEMGCLISPTQCQQTRVGTLLSPPPDSGCFSSCRAVASADAEALGRC